LFRARNFPAHEPMKSRFPLTVGWAKIQPPVSAFHRMVPAGCANDAAEANSNTKRKMRVSMQAKM